jgi:hypothetical protein
MTNWTKFSDRLPPEESEQVWVQWRNMVKADQSQRAITATWEEWHKENGHGAIAWHPITYPELPKEPEIQREKDIRAYEPAFSKLPAASDKFTQSMREMIDAVGKTAWLKALDYRDSENAVDLVDIFPANNSDHASAIKSLRRRCGLDK